MDIIFQSSCSRTMKKVGPGKGRKVHPSPLPGGVLPAAVLALEAALTEEEQEVLAYLLSDGGRWREQRPRQAHPPEPGCGCFGCYKSFWARWDASPNRHLIHRIIDAVEETLEAREIVRGGGRRRRRDKRQGKKGGELKEVTVAENLLPGLIGGRVADDGVDGFEDKDSVEELEDEDEEEEEEEEDDEEKEGEAKEEEEKEEVEEEDDVDEINDSRKNNASSKSSVRRFMSFIGESVWGVWN